VDNSLAHEISPHLQSYLSKVKQLLADVQNWVEGSGLDLIRSEATISEEEFGTYTVPVLSLSHSGKRVAQVAPVGASVIGANGRVELRGTLETAAILDFNKGGPSMTTTISIGENTETKTNYFFRGIDEAGWYWIDRITRKARMMNAELFFDLLVEVSDYER
jgi:hypothetical protein